MPWRLGAKFSSAFLRCRDFWESKISSMSSLIPGCFTDKISCLFPIMTEHSGAGHSWYWSRSRKLRAVCASSFATAQVEWRLGSGAFQKQQHGSFLDERYFISALIFPRLFSFSPTLLSSLNNASFSFPRFRQEFRQFNTPKCVIRTGTFSCSQSSARFRSKSSRHPAPSYRIPVRGVTLQSSAFLATCLKIGSWY